MLPDHPGHAAAAAQMRDFGGMVSFTLRGGEEAAPPAWLIAILGALLSSAGALIAVLIVFG
jgi:cystathionine gamma-synthase